jgi:hypothetical protein
MNRRQSFVSKMQCLRPNKITTKFKKNRSIKLATVCTLYLSKTFRNTNKIDIKYSSRQV